MLKRYSEKAGCGWSATFTVLTTERIRMPYLTRSSVASKACCSSRYNGCLDLSTSPRSDPTNRFPDFQLVPNITVRSYTVVFPAFGLRIQIFCILFSPHLHYSRTHLNRCWSMQASYFVYVFYCFTRFYSTVSVFCRFNLVGMVLAIGLVFGMGKPEWLGYSLVKVAWWSTQSFGHTWLCVCLWQRRDIFSSLRIKCEDRSQ